MDEKQPDPKQPQLFNLICPYCEVDPIVVGAARTFLDAGYLFEFTFNESRRQFAFTDPGLKDKVDNNDYKFDEG
jgi:hypothetical protein